MATAAAAAGGAMKSTQDWTAKPKRRESFAAKSLKGKPPPIALGGASPFNKISRFPSIRTPKKNALKNMPSPVGPEQTALWIDAQVMMYREMLQTKGCVIDPSTRFIRRWDIMTTLALVIVAFVTPIEVSLFSIDAESLQTDPDIISMFLLNRVIDLIFLFDMGIQACLFYDTVQDNMKRTVKQQPMIVKHYLRTWFFIDFISVIPFDIIALIPNGSGDGGKINASKFKLVRVIRLLRLLKLTRILRASRILARWRNKISFSYALRECIRLCSLLLILVHWIACIWLMVHDLECEQDCMVDPDGDRTWFTVYAGNMGLERGPAGEGLSTLIVADQTRTFRYSAAVYWTAMSLTSIGYGDLNAQNEMERWICTTIMLVMGVAWAYIIGNFSSIITTGDPLATEYKQSMDQLNRFCKLHKNELPQQLQEELRGYLYESRCVQEHCHYNKLLTKMSDKLRERVSLITTEQLTKKVFLFFHEPEPESADFEWSTDFDASIRGVAPGPLIQGLPSQRDMTPFLQESMNAMGLVVYAPKERVMAAHFDVL
jgi:hypothetical protein